MGEITRFKGIQTKTSLLNSPAVERGFDLSVIGNALQCTG